MSGKGLQGMDLATYAVEARKTQVFNPVYHVSYPTLGLCDEAGELIEKLNDRLCNLEDVVKEAGDVCWYFNCVCDYSNLSITNFFRYERVTSWVEFLIQSSKIAGIAKKALRDNDGTVDVEKMRPLLEEFSGMLLYFINVRGLTFEEILETNISKLRSRQERGVLKGSGDNR